MNSTKNAWLNLVFLVATLTINAMGALGRINGLSQKEISDRYITLITPSPATFSIWSVIYTLLLLSLLAMIIYAKDPYYRQATELITYRYRDSCLLNIAWIIAFSYVQLELSLLFIFGFVLTLASLCQQLLSLPARRRWLLPLTFGLYTGWLFIATVVNTAATLVKLKWNGFGISAPLWAATMLVIAVILVALVLTRLRNAAFPLPIAWAYWGIYQSWLTDLVGPSTPAPTVALAGLAVLVGLSVVQFYRNGWSLLPEPQKPQCA